MCENCDEMLCNYQKLRSYFSAELKSLKSAKSAATAKSKENLELQKENQELKNENQELKNIIKKLEEMNAKNKPNPLNLRQNNKAEEIRKRTIPILWEQIKNAPEVEPASYIKRVISHVKSDMQAFGVVMQVLEKDLSTISSSRDFNTLKHIVERLENFKKVEVVAFEPTVYLIYKTAEAVEKLFHLRDAYEQEKKANGGVLSKEKEKHIAWVKQRKGQLYRKLKVKTQIADLKPVIRYKFLNARISYNKLKCLLTFYKREENLTFLKKELLRFEKEYFSRV